MSRLADLKARILANPAARAEYEAQTPEFALASELIAARTRAGLTQSELAVLLGDRPRLPDSGKLRRSQPRSASYRDGHKTWSVPQLPNYRPSGARHEADLPPACGKAHVRARHM